MRAEAPAIDTKLLAIGKRQHYQLPLDPFPELRIWEANHRGLWGWITSFFDPKPKLDLYIAFERGYEAAFIQIEEQFKVWQ